MDQLTEALQAAACGLNERPDLTCETGVVSVVVVGSLARKDFVEGGSDLDLMFVHTLGDKPNEEIASNAGLQNLIHYFGDPVFDICACTGRQKPFMIDCHFVDYGLLSEQHHWANPANFLQEYTKRDTYLWLYAFDFVQNRICLWGEDPTSLIKVYSPDVYITWAAEDKRIKLSAIKNDSALEQAAEEPLLGRWKLLAGETLRLLAIRYGSRSLRKAEVYADFQELAPYFKGKEFAEELWAEYLYGKSCEDRKEWLVRCDEFCQAALSRI